MDKSFAVNSYKKMTSRPIVLLEPIQSDKYYFQNIDGEVR
ncbi:hypothetical protein FB550_107181 [Neobacillus bataviensis]|uniref:Uncharacterized protein n=1 Tax=Neobacillus bataviensis TaxID=220685 RepID=A0A561D7W9_9BACI|nr:hypothetical protein FB550_107181 [Neobacillus bataviensis]